MTISKMPDSRDLDLLRKRMTTQIQIPSAYDDALSYQGLIYKLIQYLKDTMQNVEDWNVWLEDFVSTFDKRLPDTVRNKIQELYDSGQLAELVTQVIDVIQEQIDSVNNRVDDVNSKVDVEIEGVNTRLAQTEEKKADKTYVDDRLTKIGSAKPSGAFPTLEELETTYPNGDNDNYYVVTADNNWYYWNGNVWTKGGLFNATVSDEFPATNLVSNGDFSDGKTGWAPLENITVANNEANFLATTQYASMNRNITIVKDHKYYFRALIKTDSSQVRLGLRRKTGTDIGQQYHTGSGDYEVLSSIAQDTSGDIVYPGIYIMDDRASDWTPISVKYVLVIDLTSVFGLGNEPTKDEVDNILSKYPNGWFDGTVSPLIGNKEMFVKTKEFVTKDLDGVELGSVTPAMTNFVTLGKNLFNREEALKDKSINHYNGGILDNVGYYAYSLNVEEGLPYILSRENNEVRSVLPFSFHAWYDSNNVFISGGSHQHSTDGALIAPTGAKILRFTIPEQYINQKLQVEQNNEITPYEPYRYKFTYDVDTEIENGGGSGTDSYELVLPSKIPVVIGKEMDLYYDNILKNGNAYRIERFNIMNAVGYEDHAKVIPKEDDTEKVITTRLFKNGKSIMSKLSNIIPVPKEKGSGVTKKCLFIGDSNTDNPHLIPEVVNLFSDDVMNIELLGTRGNTPALHEAISGWSSNEFCTLSEFKGTINKFYNNGFDFTYYMNNQGYDSVDYVVINLGTNDINLVGSIDGIIANYNTMIDSIRAFGPNIKIFIGLTILPAKWEKGWAETFKNQILSLVQNLITEFDNREDEGLYVMPNYLNVDPYWDYPHKEVAISSRNPKTTFVGGNDNIFGSTIHPAKEGYYKIADVIYNCIKYATA